MSWKWRERHNSIAVPRFVLLRKRPPKNGGHDFIDSASRSYRPHVRHIHGKHGGGLAYWIVRLRSTALNHRLPLLKQNGKLSLRFNSTAWFRSVQSASSSGSSRVRATQKETLQQAQHSYPSLEPAVCISLHLFAGLGSHRRALRPRPLLVVLLRLSRLFAESAESIPEGGTFCPASGILTGCTCRRKPGPSAHERGTC